MTLLLLILAVPIALALLVLLWALSLLVFRQAAVVAWTAVPAFFTWPWLGFSLLCVAVVGAIVCRDYDRRPRYVGPPTSATSRPSVGTRLAHAAERLAGFRG